MRSWAALAHLPGGPKLPEKFKNAPSLTPGLGLFYNAFLQLMSCRAVGWDEGPIPWTAIHAYAEAYDIEGDQYEDLHYHVRALDRAYLDWKRRKREDEAKAKEGARGGQ